jgi:hypothetical protein
MRQLQKQNNCQYRLEKFSSTAKNDTKGIILEFILILIWMLSITAQVTYFACVNGNFFPAVTSKPTLIIQKLVKFIGIMKSSTRFDITCYKMGASFSYVCEAF